MEQLLPRTSIESSSACFVSLILLVDAWRSRRGILRHPLTMINYDSNIS